MWILGFVHVSSWIERDSMSGCAVLFNWRISPSSEFLKGISSPRDVFFPVYGTLGTWHILKMLTRSILPSAPLSEIELENDWDSQVSSYHLPGCPDTDDDGWRQCSKPGWLKRTYAQQASLWILRSHLTTDHFCGRFNWISRIPDTEHNRSSPEPPHDYCFNDSLHDMT